MSAQERITKLEALLERVRERGTRDDAAPSAVVSSVPVTTQRTAAAPIATPPVAVAPAPAAVAPPPPPVDNAAASGIPEVTVGREVAREPVRDPREEGRRISNVPASVRGTTDQELPSVIIAPPPSASSVSPISAPPNSSVELDADDVIEAEVAPVRTLSRPPPPPPARSPTIPPQNVPTPLPVSVPAPAPAAAASQASVPSIAPSTTQPATQPSTPAAQAAHAASLNVPTPPTSAPSRPAPTPAPASASIPAAPRQPYIPEARQSENRLGDADITAGHPVSSVDVQLDDEVPTPSSSRRPRSEHAPAPEEDEISPPPHTVPPESGRQASVAPAESGKRSSVPAVESERAAAPASIRPDIVSGRQEAAQVASFTGEPAVARPADLRRALGQRSVVVERGTERVSGVGRALTQVGLPPPQDRRS